MSPPDRSLRRQRISQACDFCHRRGLKCKSPPDSQRDFSTASSCLTCLEHGQECKRTRQPKKRGTKPGISSNPESGLRGAEAQSRETVSRLLDVYFDSVHPVFPLYCERDVWVGWSEGSFPQNQSQWTSLTAMCALTLWHVHRGALFSDADNLQGPNDFAANLLQDAVFMTPVDFSQQQDINVVQAYGLLVILGIQSKNYPLAQKYLALWHGLCGLWTLHDESRWSYQLSECEREVFRRVFWVFYRLEVHLSCLTGQLIRTQEAQCNVGYPKGIHHPPFVPGRTGLFEEWFPGWNLTNDLYRLLEHLLVQLRMRHVTRRSIVLVEPSFPIDKCLRELDKIQEENHAQFLHVHHRSADSGRNRCGFQAAHILAMVHLVRLTALVLQETGFQDLLATAQAMVRGMESIPVEYLRAMGPPLLQKLTGVVFILNRLAARASLPTEAQKDLIELDGAIVALFTSVEGTAENAIKTIAKSKEGLDKDIRAGATEVGPDKFADFQNLRVTLDTGDDLQPADDMHLMFGDGLDVPRWLLDMSFPMDTVYDWTLPEYSGSASEAAHNIDLG